MPRSKPATIDAFGRIHLPKRLRDAAGLQIGMEVESREDRRASAWCLAREAHSSSASGAF